jgi:tRNA (guanosine-2'-O-)-methyltransferase
MNQLPPDPKLRAALLEELANFVTDNKRGKMAKVLDMRTRQVTIVLEDIYQSQNASATLRTADCMGLQDIYIIENYTD